MKPIPKRLLPHTIIVERVSNDDLFGETWAEPFEIHRVNVQHKKKLVRGANGITIEANTLIFIDAVNSLPAVALKANDKIIFKGTEMHVTSIDILYGDKDNPHHWEVWCL